MKKDTTVSEKKWAPEAILETETRIPNPMAAAATRRFRLASGMTASAKKAPAASPDENEQLRLHPSVTTKAGVNCCAPPNSAMSLGLARPKLSLSARLTIRPQPTIR